MKSRRNKGFTLLELMIVVAIAAILLAVAVPMLQPQVASASAKATADNIADGLRYARQYALNTSSLVTFSPNGCGYTVTTSTGTQVLSAASAAPTGVSCQALPQTVSFLGDGSVALCTAGAQGALSCTAATSTTSLSKLLASVNGGGTLWQIQLSYGGVVTTSPS
jgi:type II secretion system protein H